MQQINGLKTTTNLYVELAIWFQKLIKSVILNNISKSVLFGCVFLRNYGLKT